MWARVSELVFGMWLLVSPLVFDPPSAAAWITDLLAGGVLVVLTAVNYKYPLRRYYLAVPLVGIGLIVAALMSGPHPLAAHRQNDIVVGFTIMMFGIVPNRTLRPPEKWRQFEIDRAS